MNIRTIHRSRALTAAALATGGLLLSACGTGTSHDAAPSHMMSDMPMAQGDGLSASEDGYTLTLTSALTTTKPLRFVIAKDGTPVTSYQTEQTKQLHL